MAAYESGDDRKSGTRFAALDQPLLAIFRSDANGCSVALCQRRQPPKAGAVGQRLQRVGGTAILDHQERRLISRRCNNAIGLQRRL